MLFPTHISSPQADQPASVPELPPGTLEAHLNLQQAPLRTAGHTEGPRAQTSLSEVWLAQGTKPNPVPRSTGTVLMADEPGVSNTMFSPSVNIKKIKKSFCNTIHNVWWKHYTWKKQPLLGRLQSTQTFSSQFSTSLPPVPTRKPRTASHCVILSGLGMICLATRQHQPSPTSRSQHGSVQTQIYRRPLSRLEEMPACLP